MCTDSKRATGVGPATSSLGMGRKRKSKTLIYRDNLRQVAILARFLASMTFADFRLVSLLNRHHYRHQKEANVEPR